MSKRRTFEIALVTMFVGLATAIVVANTQAGSTGAEEHVNVRLPIVKIMSPESNSIHGWNTLVPYSIVVSDNGKSTKYQEIPSKEVLLKTTYVSDLSRGVANLRDIGKSEPAGLMDIMTSNCLGCHDFRAKAMGPSFYAISGRYANNALNVDAISRYIRNGSVGRWGQARMPSHPDLTEAKLHDISLWIVNGLTNPNVNYYVGTDGTFKMESPEKPSSKAGVILTASFISYGTKQNPHRPERGEDTIVVRGR